MGAFGLSISLRAIKAWRRFQMLPRGVRIIWLWHLLVLLTLASLLSHWKVPKDWQLQQLAGGAPKFSYVLHAGWRKAGILHLCGSALLLVTVGLWGRTLNFSRETRLLPLQPKRWWFWPVLLTIMLGAGVLRWPRMAHSYWGDEGQAVRNYGHGRYEAIDGDNMQGSISFVATGWRHALWDDVSGSNHYLFSVLQKAVLDGWRGLRGLPASAFNEMVSRLPVFVAGIASIAILALFLSWLGRPRAGLFGSVYLALHPWHIRYSTEARGYMLLLLFFVLATWLMFHAVRTLSWRSWLLFGVSVFLAAYAWKLAILPLSAASIVVTTWLIGSRGNGAVAWRDRLSRIAAPAVVIVTAAMAFAFMAAPGGMQSARVIERLRHVGKSMDAQWLHDSVSGLLFGRSWHRDATANPVETPLVDAFADSPLATGAGIIVMLLLVVTGVIALLRKHAMHGWMWLAVVLSAAIGAAAFLWLIKIEWISWYFFFLILPLAIFTSLGMEELWDGLVSWIRSAVMPSSRAIALATVCPLGFGLVAAISIVSPQIRMMRDHPYEPFREAFQLTRGEHEPAGFTGPTNVVTCYLWRFIDLYDPRGTTRVRDGGQLRKLMREADRSGGALYYIVGQRDLFHNLQKEVSLLLRDASLFEFKTTLWAEDDIHTLEIYRYRGQTKAE